MIIMNGYRDLVERQGHIVGIDTEICVTWKLDNPRVNCQGCPSELGCIKYGSLLIISTAPLMYTLKDFTDYSKMINSMRELIQQVLEAKTPDEVKAVQII